MTDTDTTERKPNKIHAPWSSATADALNHYQTTTTFHPFTCPDRHDGRRALIATEQGWHCRHDPCPYRQDWAWTFMAIPGHGREC